MLGAWNLPFARGQNGKSQDGKWLNGASGGRSKLMKIGAGGHFMFK